MKDGHRSIDALAVYTTDTFNKLDNARCMILLAFSLNSIMRQDSLDMFIGVRESENNCAREENTNFSDFLLTLLSTNDIQECYFLFFDSYFFFMC